MDRGTLIRTIVLGVALLNQLLVTLGKSPLPFDQAELEQGLSVAFTVIASGVAWFKNNYVTKTGKAQKQVIDQAGLTRAQSRARARARASTTVSATNTAGNATFMWPTNTRRITNGFRTGNNHHGIDIAESGNRPIYATADGEVTRSYFSSSYGECIMIKHVVNGQTWESVYAHMRTGTRRVFTGARVRQGQQIGIMGNTGDSTGQHLHFELHLGRWNFSKSNAVNPIDYLDKDLTPGGSTYTVQSGDTLSGIAARFNTTADAIAEANNIDNKDLIYPGQQLRIPGSGSTSPSTDLPTGILRRGNSGDDVRKVQQALVSVYFYPDKANRNYGVDGIYGPNTEDAVRRFQSVHLPYEVDGIYGPNTRAKLIEVINN